MSVLKNEREQARKQTQGLAQEVREIQDKITRQTGSLSSGLQDLKAHLDQKDSEKNQSVSKIILCNGVLLNTY